MRHDHHFFSFFFPFSLRSGISGVDDIIFVYKIHPSNLYLFMGFWNSFFSWVILMQKKTWPLVSALNMTFSEGYFTYHWQKTKMGTLVVKALKYLLLVHISLTFIYTNEFASASPVTPPAAKMSRRLVAVQGMVYCKSCKYSGIDTLLEASPLQGCYITISGLL